jgi:hypothetical protein
LKQPERINSLIRPNQTTAGNNLKPAGNGEETAAGQNTGGLFVSGAGNFAVEAYYQIPHSFRISELCIGAGVSAAGCPRPIVRGYRQ